MNSFKVFTKEYSGHDCKKLRSGALLSVILFCSVYFSEIKLPIAPKIMHLMAFSFTAGIMLQTLSSNKNRESLSEIFTLPFSENIKGEGEEGKTFLAPASPSLPNSTCLCS